jgi:hypothetical protein
VFMGVVLLTLAQPNPITTRYRRQTILLKYRGEYESGSFDTALLCIQYYALALSRLGVKDTYSDNSTNLHSIISLSVQAPCLNISGLFTMHHSPK